MAKLVAAPSWNSTTRPVPVKITRGNNHTMRHFFIALFALAVLAPIHQAHADGAAPFYVWGEDIPQKAGALLRQEPLQADFVLEEAAKGVRILYASQGWNNQWVAVSGDVLIPKGEAPEGGWPVIAWSHGTVGVADICAPSFSGRSSRDITYLNKWLAAGYAIVSTDYEGLGTPGGHTYLHCESEANGNIDAVRASQQLDANLSNSWMVMGQSQGGQGALCTGAYVKKRAPESDFRGTLATAPAVNWKDRFAAGSADEPSPFFGMSLFLARGFEVYEPSFNSSEAFTEAGMALLPHTDDKCVGPLIGIGMKANLTMGESLKIVPFGDIPGTSEGAEKMEVPTEGWSAPAYIGQGDADPLVRFQDVANYAAALCDEGVNVTLDVYEGAKHSGPMNQGFDAFKQWVASRFNNQPLPDTCEMIETITP
jgi:acetyl esterase/lipase